MAKMDCEGWWAPGLGRNASIVWIGSMLHGGSRESKKNSYISPMGMISRTSRGSLGKLEQHEVDALERRCGHGGIRNDQSANWSLSARLGTPRANGEWFESIEAKLDELRSYLYANRESVMGYAEAY